MTAAALILLSCASPTRAAEVPSAVVLARTPVCDTIAEAARLHGLPLAYFTRLIWRESRFHPNALSPAGAQGVAQFMPGTAAERGLVDPFAAREALQHSAAFLDELRGTFGNLGLAAAAYNAGPGRVTRWLAGQAELPLETQDYVAAITGHAAEEWRARPAPALREDKDFSCSRWALVAAHEPDPTRSAGGAPPKPWAVILIGNPQRDKVVSEYAQVRGRFSAVLGGVATRVVLRRVSAWRSHASSCRSSARAASRPMPCARACCARGAPASWSPTEAEAYDHTMNRIRERLRSRVVGVPCHEGGNPMAFKHALIAISLLAVAPATAMAQGTVRGAEEGANAGDRAAGPVGGVVGGATGAAAGTVGGVLGIGADRDRGCESKTVTHEDAAGSDTVKRTNCN